MATNAELTQRWMIEAGRSDPHFLHRGESLFVTKNEGILYFDREGRGQWGGGRPSRNVQLARYVGGRYNGGVCLLNGDGLNDMVATDQQAHIRNLANAQFGWERCAVVPYQAMEGAGIDPTTFRTIEVTQDTNEREDHILDLPLDAYASPDRLAGAGFKRTDSYQSDPEYHLQTWEGQIDSQRLMIQIRNNVANSRVADQFSVDRVWAITSVSLWAQPEFGAFAWQGVSRHSTYLSHRLANPRTGESYRSWHWTENVHRLGSVVFSANGRDGIRHRWISAFDMQEPGGLYFLAQVPRKGKCTTYAEAIDLLAPPIVHQARATGRRVYRQGDVFAVEISWTDEQVYEGAVTRVRREVVMQNLENVLARGLPPVPPAEGEVTENGTCPFCISVHAFGNGPRARRAISIHNTGHTADEVVVKKKGTTYIRGHMYHDPQLDDTTRTAEHQPILLVHREGESHGWFVAVRNTVPRLRAPRVVERPAASTVSGREAIAVTANEVVRRQRRQRDQVQAGAAF